MTRHQKGSWFSNPLLKGASKNSGFIVLARKRSTQNRRLLCTNKVSRAALAQLPQKRRIFRSAFKPKGIFVALALTSQLSPIFVLADSNSHPIDQADYLSEIPIVDSATRLNQKITDVPASITIIDSELIEASGATEIPQLFRFAPGYLSYYVSGNQFGVTNRGSSLEFPGDLEIMIDGRSVYEPFFSAVEWSSLGVTLKDIDHIEIVRGSNTPAYGSNAYLGAINIVTKSPLQAKGTSIETTFGDIGTRNSALRHNTRLKNIDLSVGLTYRYNEGFPKLEAVNIPFDKINDTNEALHFIVKGLYTPSLNDSLEFQVGLGKSTINLPYAPPHGDIQGFNHRQYRNDFQLLRWTRQIKDDNELKLQLYHNRLAVDELRNLDLLSTIENLSPTQIPEIFNGHPDEQIVFDIRDTQSDRTDIEIQHKITLGERMRLVWGAGARYDWLQSEFLIGDSNSIDELQYRLFSNLEWCLHKNWTLNLGAMAESNNIVGEFVSPRLALNYKPSNHQVFHLAYSYGNRTPSVLEAKQLQTTRFGDGALINAQFVSSKNIEKSRVREFELGYRSAYWRNKVSIDLRLFRTEADGVIGKYRDFYPDLDQTALYISNTTDWVNKGFDTQLQWRPDSNSLLSFQYAYSDFAGSRLKQLSPQVLSELNQEIPKHNANLLITKTYSQNWKASLIWYYLSSITWREGDRVKSHDRLDFTLTKTFQFSDKKVTAELIAQNLLNEYPEFKTINQFKTRIFARLSIDLP